MYILHFATSYFYEKFNKTNKILSIFSPVTYAWFGGKKLSEDTIFPNLLVTREEYEEEGSSLCFEKFDV